MKEKPKAEIRSDWIKFRVSPSDKAAIYAKAEAQGQTVTDFLRQRALDYRLRISPFEKERVRQIARAGNNLNQIARWVNTYKSRADALEVIVALTSLERAICAIPMDEDEPCL
jgi:transposase-like protein